MMDEKFLAEIDRSFSKAGFADRSTFIRDAVFKSLTELGIAIPQELMAAPPRIGKGGRKKISNSGIIVDGHGNTVTQHLSTSRSSLPRSAVHRATAGKKPGKKNPKKK